MPFLSSVSQLTVEQVIHQILARRRISPMDQHLLMSLLLSKDSISPQEQRLVDELFEALKNGKLRVVN